MAKFEVDENGNVTLTFNVNELSYTDCAKNTGNKSHCIPNTPSLIGFAKTIAHLIEHKPSNWSLDGAKYLRQMGLHKYNVTPANWDKMEYYCIDDTTVKNLTSHFRGGVTIREDKKWFNGES